jgi:hypothetical protein
VKKGRACPQCGAGADARQEYCLDCGERLVATPRSVHWLWPTAVAALIAAAGAAVAVAAGSDDTAQSTIVALTPLHRLPAGTPPADRTLVRWPRRDGYTIVLTVVPATLGRATAEARARRAAAAPLPDVGLLTSAEYASLHPGYFVVFSGVYDTLDAAVAALPRAKRRFRSAYAQQIAH